MEILFVWDKIIGYFKEPNTLFQGMNEKNKEYMKYLA